jgi:YHS domain-containing protein
MPATKRGIYHNLKESEYTISNMEVVFFFSSELYMNKFLKEYEKNRKHVHERIEQTTGEHLLNMNTLADITLYKRIEKRGFRAWLKGVDVTWQDLRLYVLRKMTEKSSLNWQRIAKPKLRERLKTME